MDNQDTQVQDNVVTPDGTQQDAVQDAAPTGFSWKSGLSPDLRNSPTMHKFEDSQEGLSKAIESHLSLEKLLGHEKVPIPKDANDVEGWNRFSKALGIPDKAEGYGLADVKMPESMKEMSFDKNKFAETVHAFKLTPSQAKGLWEAYTNMSLEGYKKAVESHEKKITDVVNTLRGKWGDEYETNVDLGQKVINQFSADQDMQDYLTSTLTKDPRGIEFLAKVGGQFAENKIGEFKNARFSLSPENAQAELDKILTDPNHPYLNEKATPAEHQRAIDYVNSLYKIINSR